MTERLKEGTIKKGGVNKDPTGPKPNIKPPPQGGGMAKSLRYEQALAEKQVVIENLRHALREKTDALDGAHQKIRELMKDVQTANMRANYAYMDRR